MNPTNQETPVSQPTPPSPNSSWLKTFSIGFSIISFGITIAIVGYIVLTTKQNQTANQPSPTPLPSETSVKKDDETANWRVHTIGNKVSFKYPPDLFVKETDKDFVVILPAENTPSQKAEIIVDARATSINLRLYNEAIDIYKNEIIANPTIEKIVNGVKISGIHKLDQRPISIAIFKFHEGAIAAEYTGDPTKINTFDQILSTFQFSP